MSTGGSDFISVPEPLFKYRGEQIIHDDNDAIMSLHQDATILDKRTVKNLTQELSEITERLTQNLIDDRLAQFDQLKQEYNSTLLEYKQVRDTIQQIQSLEDGSELFPALLWWVPRLDRAYHRLIHDGKRLQRQITQLRAILTPYRADIQRRGQITQQLQSHQAAVDDERKSEILRLQMAEEANLIAQQMQRTLARLGFAHTYTKGKKNITDYVQFERVYATPDQLQYKISATKQGLWGGTIDMLPHGVWVSDIIKRRVMDELSTTLEREVWNPHDTDNLPTVNGAWIIVERLGLVEGIPKNVTYQQLMARYETADHERFPIPAGLKRGRRINWVHLDSPSGIHFMFTGISGSGKSNAMRAMVSAIVEKQDPGDVQFAFVDLKKQGDFREFEQTPHAIDLEGKRVLTEIDEVVDVLQRIRAEMHMRQRVIGQVANNLIDYNKRVSREHRMPRIVVVFDEYANTRRARYADQADVIDDICIEIGQVGRAAGISLWIGIQQPRRDNMPSSLRDNITTQFVGHQANVGAAQSATGNRESLKLEDFPGRMSATVGWKTEKVQMPFISEDDVRLAVQIARDNFGDVNPYRLISLDDLSDTDQYAPVTDEQIILNTAFEELNGELKIYKLHDLLKSQFSRNEIKRVVDRFTSEGAVEYNGETYTVEKQPGNYFILVLTDNQITASV